MHPSTESTPVHEPFVDDRSRELDGSTIRARNVAPAAATKSVTPLLVNALIGLTVVIVGGVFILYKMRVEIPALNTPKIYASIDSMIGHSEESKEGAAGHTGAESHNEGSEGHAEQEKIVVTSPLVKDVIITQPFVCQIHSRNHINVSALQDGYLEPITIKEGQAVKEGEVLFSVVPTLYRARRDAKLAERDVKQMELNYTKDLAAKNGVSQNEVKLFQAKLAMAQAELDLAEAELNFTKVTARFDGIIDKLHEQKGSLVKKGDILTTLSDNAVMWVYFNVPEAQYLEYMNSTEQQKKDQKVELELANHKKFPHPAIALRIEGQFNNETGNIAFRADFDNPHNILRYGQTGTILVHRPLKNALVIPQRAIFELLDKRYVWVLDEKDVAHQRLITIKHELDDIFVIDTGLEVKDKIVMEGVRQVKEGEKVEYDFRKPEDAVRNQKNHAE